MDWFDIIETEIANADFKEAFGYHELFAPETPPKSPSDPTDMMGGLFGSDGGLGEREALDALMLLLEEEIAERESEDKLGNFEIQRLMQIMNQKETLASKVQEKQEDRKNAYIGKV
jgi:hypothetical protein